MTLSISVALLHDQARNDPEGHDRHRRAFARLSRALRADNIRWEEPDTTALAVAHTFSGGIPYGYLTCLRRAFVLVGRGGPVSPAPRPDTEAWHRGLAAIDDETSLLASHLLCHADDAGYYIPVDFPDPLFLPPEAEVAGAGMVGSSQRLLAELSSMAPWLGTPASAESPGDDPVAPERSAWHQLRQACRASILGGHAIEFH